MSDVITTRREGAVLEVTLDRPKANAIDLETSRLMGETFQAFRDDPGAARRHRQDGRRQVLLRRLGPQGRGRRRRGRRRLRRRRLRRPAGAARHEQAGDRLRQRHGGRRRLRAGAVLRPHLRRRPFELRAAGDPRRHAGRRRDDQAAEAHPLSCRDGPAADRPLDGRRRGASLGPRQRGAAEGQARGPRLGDRPPARLGPAAGLRGDQGGGARSRGAELPGRA